MEEKKIGHLHFRCMQVFIYYVAKSDEHVYQGSVTLQIGLHSNPSINPGFFFTESCKTHEKNYCLTVKGTLASYGTRTVITVFAMSVHYSLSLTRRVQSASSQRFL